ncbi:MAG: hypothetical protein J6A37_02770 [Oscillospiraceae bacterium]|nr:hypothetical protein [Oscillospiraceae bacterium]
MIIREPLKEGTIIRDRDNIYTIKKMIGEGASCLVYDADFVDDQGIIYKVRIKECFPINYALSRRADGNIIGDKDGLEKAKTRFKASYERLVDLRNNNKNITNYIVVPIRLFEANNTMYSVFPVDVGKNYGQLLEESFANKGNCTLKDAMVRFNKIANVVLQFHKANALCLDIKPQNIFILDTKPEIVKLFDFDSVATIHEGQNSLEYVSFSNGFAAPEQLTGDKDNISKKTDVYALGAMLYYVLFGKHYDCLDKINDVGIECNTMLYTDYHPAFAKKLKKFFDMTLAIWPEDRKEMADVIKSLECLIMNSDPYSILEYIDDENGELEDAPVDSNLEAVPRYVELLKLAYCNGSIKPDDETKCKIINLIKKYIIEKCDTGKKVFDFMQTMVYLINNMRSACLFEDLGIVFKAAQSRFNECSIYNVYLQLLGWLINFNFVNGTSQEQIEAWNYDIADIAKEQFIKLETVYKNYKKINGENHYIEDILLHIKQRYGDFRNKDAYFPCHCNNPPILPEELLTFKNYFDGI